LADRPLSLVFTGHMVDKPDRSSQRFPQALVAAAQSELEWRIARWTRGRETTDVQGFASLARGGDILFHEICRDFGFATTIVLPFAPQLFLKTSVEGVEEEDWPARFQKLWDETPPERRHDLGLPKSDEAYATCNAHILELAEGAGEPQLIAILDGGGGDGLGGTADFVRQVKQSAGREPDVIDPKELTPSANG
jgi:hypothetical protein